MRAVPPISPQWASPRVLPDSVRRALLQLNERHGRHLPAATSLLFTMLLAVAAARLVWTLMPTPEAARWQPAPPLASDAAAGSESPDVAGIQNAQLFGAYQADAGGAVDAPETRLNLRLLGIFAFDDEQRSRALVETQPGNEDAFGVGDRISAGVTLQAIFADRIVLSRAGRLETLRLEKDQPSSFSAPRAERPAPAGVTSLAAIRNQVLQDPSRAGEYVRVQPSNREGKLYGYRIYPGKDRAVFTGAGLKPGDLVTQVNGIQLDDASKALKMLSDLKDYQQITLVVERGGEQQTITVDLN